jgi:hypothetical protein
MGLHKNFFEGQIPPPIELASLESIEWHNEMIRRSMEGYSYGGHRITADHWFFMNHFPMQRVIMRNGKATRDFTFDFPFWSQEDDWVFKQFEEAHHEGKAIFLFTGRSFGKTYMVASIPVKLYLFKILSKSLITGSMDEHATETFDKVIEALNGIDKLFPGFRLKRLVDNPKLIRAGETVYSTASNGQRVKDENRTGGEIKKIIYDKKPGKSKGKRIDFQQFEEAGDWTGAATLRECIGASEGSWKVGDIIRCRVFYTGTGGTIKSLEAKELFYNPDAFDIYPVTYWNDRKTGIVIPAFQKYGGFWEGDGISDIVGAKARLEEIRAAKKSDPIAYRKHVQEYPFNPEELFTVMGGNNFDQDKLAEQYIRIKNNIDAQRGEYGDLHWRRKDGKIVGVEWTPEPNGPMWQLEKPERMTDGEVYPNLYVAGYDGIDMGTEDTASGKGSQGSIAVKKRMLSSLKTNNVYVFYYHDRPADADILYEGCLKVSWYFDCLINIEDSKRAIVTYFKVKGQFHRFMKRPRLTLSDPTAGINKTTLIGVTPTVKNFEYGEAFFARFIKDYSENMYYVPSIEQARDFSMEWRGSFDITMSEFMAELGDDELMDKLIIPPKPEHTSHDMGYYTNAKGEKVWGKLPKKEEYVDQFNFGRNALLPDVINKN